MFLDQNSFTKNASYSMDYFKEWSQNIAHDFLNGGDSPTEGLVKIAKEKGFEPHQVQTLAGEVNRLIHQKKYASAKEKYHAADFPLADAKEAINSLQADGGEVKLAVAMPEPKFSRPEDHQSEFHKAFGLEPDTMDKHAFQKEASAKFEVKCTFEKTAFLKEKLSEELTLKKYASEAAESNFIKTARKMLVSETSSQQRYENLNDIDDLCKQAGMEEVSRKPLAKLAYACMKEGLMEPGMAKKAMNYFMPKEADEKAPQSLISGSLKSRVVNGKHPLYITLKTVQDCQDSYDITKDRYSLVDDKLRILGQRVRAL